LTHDGAIALLESTHSFPCAYTIKAIGAASNDFEGRVLRAARSTFPRPDDITHSSRATPNGAHVAVTLVVQVDTPDEVITVYRAVQLVEGLRFLI
jgi:uncharacterized protein